MGTWTSIVILTALKCGDSRFRKNDRKNNSGCPFPDY